MKILELVCGCFLVSNINLCTVYGETQSPESLFCQKLFIYRYRLRIQDPVPIFLETTLGDTLEIPCPLCIANPKQAVNWFVQRHTAKFETVPPYLVKDDSLLKLDKEIYPPAETPVEEITDDPSTFDEFNRIFVEKSNNLIIRNLSGKSELDEFSTDQNFCSVENSS